MHWRRGWKSVQILKKLLKVIAKNYRNISIKVLAMIMIIFGPQF
jgi:hypothetical protein